MAEPVDIYIKELMGLIGKGKYKVPAFKHRPFAPKVTHRAIRAEGKIPTYFREQLKGLEAEKGYELGREEQEYRQALSEALGGYTGRGVLFSSQRERGLERAGEERGKRLKEYMRKYKQAEKGVKQERSKQLWQEVQHRYETEYKPKYEMARAEHYRGWMRKLPKKYRQQALGYFPM